MPLSSVIVLALASLAALPPAQQESLPEWSAAWEQSFADEQEVADVMERVTTFGDRVAFGRRREASDGSPEYFVELRDGQGGLVWERGLADLESESVSNFSDLEFSPDGSVVLLMVRLGATASPGVFRRSVQALNVSTGAQAWRLEYEGPGLLSWLLPGGAGRSFALDSGSGIVRWMELDVGTGVASPAVEVTSGLFTTPAVSVVHGLMYGSSIENSQELIRAWDLVSGAPVWSEAHSQSSDLDLSVDESILAVMRLDSVRGLDPATGVQQWGRFIEANDLIAGGSRFFAVGGVGPGFGTENLMSALEVATGDVAWSATRPDAPSLFQSVGYDAVRDRVAFALSGLRVVVLEGSDGASVGEIVLQVLPRDLRALDVGPAGGWAVQASTSSTPPFEPGLIALDATVSTAWEAADGGTVATAAEPIWVEATADGRVAVLEQRLGGGGVAYRELALADGEPLIEWEAGDNGVLPETVEVSPTGTQIAWISSPTSSSSQPTPAQTLRRRILATGAETFSWFNPGLDCFADPQLRWTPDGLALALVGTLCGGDLTFRVFSGGAGVPGTQTLSPSPAVVGAELRTGALRWSADGTRLAGAVREGPGTGTAGVALRLFAGDPANATAQLGPRVDLDGTFGLGGVYREQPLDIVELPQSGRWRVALRLEDGLVGTHRFALAELDGTTGALVQASLLPVAPDLNHVDPRGAAFDAAGEVLDLAWRPAADQGTGAGAVGVGRFSASDGQALWTRTVDLPWPTTSATLRRGAGDRSVAVVAEQSPSAAGLTAVEVALWAHDAQSGAELYDVPQLIERRAGGDSTDPGSERAWAVVGDSVALGGVGSGSGEPQDPEFAAARLGTLLDGGEEISLASPVPVPFVLQRGPEAAGRVFLLLGSRSGTAPGTPVDGVTVPLVLDGYTLATFSGAGGAVFQGTLGVLDGEGTARAVVAPPAGLSASLVGLELFHAAIDFELFSPVDAVSQATSFRFVP